MKICGWERLGGRELICDAEAAKRWENLNNLFCAQLSLPIGLHLEHLEFLPTLTMVVFLAFLLSIRFWPFAGLILNRENFAVCCARLDLTRRNLILQYETFFFGSRRLFSVRTVLCAYNFFYDSSLLFYDLIHLWILQTLCGAQLAPNDQLQAITDDWNALLSRETSNFFSGALFSSPQSAARNLFFARLLRWEPAWCRVEAEWRQHHNREPKRRVLLCDSTELKSFSFHVQLCEC